MPHNKQLNNRACSGRTGEYWPSVVAVLPRPRANIIAKLESESFLKTNPEPRYLSLSGLIYTFTMLAKNRTTGSVEGVSKQMYKIISLLLWIYVVVNTANVAIFVVLQKTEQNYSEVHAASLFFLITPIKFLICGAVDI